MNELLCLKNAVYLVAPKRLPGFWFFQLPWVPIIHFMWYPLLLVPPHFLGIVWYRQCGLRVRYEQFKVNTKSLKKYINRCLNMFSLFYRSTTTSGDQRLHRRRNYSNGSNCEFRMCILRRKSPGNNHLVLIPN